MQNKLVYSHRSSKDLSETLSTFKLEFLPFSEKINDCAKVYYYLQLDVDSKDNARHSMSFNIVSDISVPFDTQNHICKSTYKGYFWQHQRRLWCVLSSLNRTRVATLCVFGTRTMCMRSA